MRAEALIILRSEGDEIGVCETDTCSLFLNLFFETFYKLNWLQITAEFPIKESFDMISQKSFHAIKHRAILSFGK